MDRRKAEILAPAGSFECLEAAMSAGADAVYVGGDQFSARAYAHNFDQDELIRAIDYVHLLGRKLYLTVNILLKESEMQPCLDWLLPLYEQGLDAVIVQDFGLCKALRENFPDLPVHASTQMSIASYAGMKLLKDYGIKRVIPARELSLDEIEKLTSSGEMEIEAFVHGAMCYAYSGKCLFSSFLGNRSGNRGRCAQPCRLSYRNEGDHDSFYWLSMQDLSMITRIPELIRAGVVSFKIEGRMKSADYVYTVTSLYRNYTDLYLKQSENDSASDPVVSQKDLNLLASYSRTLTGSGYYDRRNGPSMITKNDPSFRAGSKENKSPSRFVVPPVPVSASVLIREGVPARLSYSAGNAKITVSSGMPVQEALKAPLRYEDVTDRLSRTDRDPFCIRWSHAEIEEKSFLPVGELNQMRRFALKSLKDELLLAYKRKASLNACERAREAVEGDMCSKEDRGVHVLVSNHDQFEAVIHNTHITEISVESSWLHDPNQLDSLIRMAHRSDRPKKLTVALPHMVRFDGQTDFVPEVFDKEWIEYLNRTDGVLIRSIDEAAYMKENGLTVPMKADFLLYAFNSASVRFLAENGIDGCCYPLELHHKDIRDTEYEIMRDVSLSSFEREVLVYGFVPRMISAQCIKKNSSGCAHSSGFSTMTDRKGEKFRVQNRCDSCYNILYNSVPVSLHTRLAALKQLNGTGYRFDFTTESPDLIREVLGLFTGECETCSYRYTKGHWDKGIL